MNKVKQKKYCKDCSHYWTKGKCGNWCCNFYGGSAFKNIGHCLNVNGRDLIQLKQTKVKYD